MHEAPPHLRFRLLCVVFWGALLARFGGTGDDPGTRNVTETDCEGVNGGEAGNLCHVDCSNSGVCDYTDGTCSCSEGYHGLNCGIKIEYG